MPHRRNPPSGAAYFETLTAHTFNSGVAMVGGYPVPDDDSVHEIHGQLTVTGASDTVVLVVQEHAFVQKLLAAGRLQVGMTTTPDPEGSLYDDPYAASPYDVADPYADIYYPTPDEGPAYSPPERTGFTVDEGGNTRVSGFVVIKNVPRALVLRAPTGQYYSFEIDAEGRLTQVGQLIGPVPP